MSTSDTERRDAGDELDGGLEAPQEKLDDGVETPQEKLGDGVEAPPATEDSAPQEEPAGGDTVDEGSSNQDLQRSEDEDGEIFDAEEQHGKHAKVMEIREEYSGALPHPRHIEHYAQIYPDAPRIIFTSFEEQGQHRRAMERKLLDGSERRATIGQVLGTVLVASVIVLGFACVLAGQAVAGTTMVGLALTSGVLTYVFGDFPGKKKKKR